MRPISEATSRVTSKNFSRKYISIGRIVKHWEEIIGADLARKAQPLKLHYQKRLKNQKPSATLDIATTSADATLLHYQKDLILERINQIFGERWITGIRFIAVPANISAKKGRKPQTPLTEGQKNHLSTMLDNIEDTDIRYKLENLGQAILMEDKT